MSKALPEFVSHCAELLAPLGSVRVNRMFGGHGIYLDELFIAIVIEERLFLKVDAETLPRFVDAGCEAFEYQREGKTASIRYRSVPAEAMESPALMSPWARLAIGAALRARASKQKPSARRAGKQANAPGRVSAKRARPTSR